MNGGTAKIEVWHLHPFPCHFWLFSRVMSLRFRGKWILCCCIVTSDLSHPKFPSTNLKNSHHNIQSWTNWSSSWDEFSSWVHMEAGDVVLTHRAFATRDLVICKRDMQDIGQGLSITENCTSSCKAKTTKRKKLEGSFLTYLYVVHTTRLWNWFSLPGPSLFIVT